MIQYLNLRAKKVETTSDNYQLISVEIKDVEKYNVISHLTIQDFLEHFDTERILDEIGQTYCEDYFGLVEKNED